MPLNFITPITGPVPVPVPVPDLPNPISNLVNSSPQIDRDSKDAPFAQFAQFDAEGDFLMTPRSAAALSATSIAGTGSGGSGGSVFEMPAPLSPIDMWNLSPTDYDSKSVGPVRDFSLAIQSNWTGTSPLPSQPLPHVRCVPTGVFGMTDVCDVCRHEIMGDRCYSHSGRSIRWFISQSNVACDVASILLSSSNDVL